MVTTSETNILSETAPPALGELAGRRSHIYRTLSAAYARPADEQLLEVLRHWAAPESQLSPEALPAKMERGLRKIRVWLQRQASQPSEASLLGAEFTRLFRGLNRFHSPPPPYESVYVDEGLLYGPSTDLVAQRYRRFQLKGQSNEPPDHIALELDFMRFLCEREAEEGGQDLLKEEGSFLKKHLARWVPAFCENIRRHDTTGFYSGLADVTEGWIRCDRRIIRELVTDR